MGHVQKNLFGGPLATGQWYAYKITMPSVWTKADYTGTQKYAYVHIYTQMPTKWEKGGI